MKFVLILLLSSAAAGAVFAQEISPNCTQDVEQILFDFFVHDGESDSTEDVEVESTKPDEPVISRVERSSVPRRKSSSKKSPSSLKKYNAYMDVVLKRMNSMIKTKNMDPLNVNLFSKNKNNKKKPSKKKRKGAKNSNKARSEDVDEQESPEPGDLSFRDMRSAILNGSVETRGMDKKPTRGVLKGLSSLRRNGNVDVIKQSDKVRIIRSKFVLGPVTLDIIPKTPSQKQSNVTAVAQQLKGVLEVRLKKNSPTSIKRLRVFPPSSVNVKNKSPSSSPRYSKVFPVATQRLRQIANAVVKTNTSNI